jgi:hypothetical protein
MAALLAWKVVRTDWIVVAPYWFHDSDPPASDEYGPYPISLPISPLWHPPQPQEIDSSVETQWRDPVRDPYPHKDWESFFPGGGAWGITGPPRLQLNWQLIGIKLVGAFVVTYPAVVCVTFMVRRFTRAAAPTSMPNERIA